MNIARFIQAKLKRAQSATAATASSTAGRVPPGQRVVTNFPVLDLGERPAIAVPDWRLEIAGAVEQPQTLDWAAFQALPQVERVVDIHCVTRWSRLDVPWRGVSTQDLAARVRPRPDAAFVVLHAHDGYTTNLPLPPFLDDDVLLAHSVDGKPLTREHGGPVRLVVPKRYFWKSAKWLRAIVFHTEDQPGFWETRGYHNEGDPWQEQRFGRK